MMLPAVHRLATAASTLDLLHDLATTGAPDGEVIVAEEQTGGRGTRGRSWHSPRGGLWFSILRREPDAESLEILSLRVGLVAAQTIEAVYPAVRLQLKWPNDLMLGERKAGGILCEARWQGSQPSWVVIGIGLNVANDIPPGLEESAAAISAAEPDAAAGKLAEPLTDRLRALDTTSGRLGPDELEGYRERDWLLGRPVSEPVAGVARGIRPDGTLVVERQDGTIIPVRAGLVVPVKLGE